MKNKSTSVFITFILALSISLFTSNQAIAQVNDIFELNSASKIQAKSTIAKSINAESTNDRIEFYNLIHNLHPTIYIVNNTIKKVYGKNQIKKITIEDSNSYNILNSKNNKYKSVELITLKLNSINDLNNQLDLTTISELESLKYVYIKCYFKHTPDDIKNFIKTNSNVRVFHIYANPS